MSIIHVIRVELHRMWRNRLARVALFAMMILPLLYSSLYLWAFWDPYGNLDKLPVAIVNEDAGAVQNGKSVNFGNDLAKKLIDDKKLDWSWTSYSAAMHGLNENQYYMVLKIPSGFSADLVSAGTDHPTKAQLDFIPNQGRNYLAGQIVSHVQSDLSAALAQQFSQQYINNLLLAVGKEANGLSSIANAANQLSQGANKVAAGSRSVADGTTQAKSGADQLVSALTKITPASAQLANGMTQIGEGTTAAQQGVQKGANAIGTIRSQISPIAGPSSQLAQGMQQLSDGAGKLQGASEQLASGTNQAVQSANQLASGMQSAASGSNQIASGIAQVNQLLQASAAKADPDVNQALQILQQLAPASQNLGTNLGQLHDGTTQLASSLGQVQSGQTQLTSELVGFQQNMQKMNQSTEAFANQLGQLDAGLGQVQTGLTQASNGLNQLNSAEKRLKSGANQLHQGLLAATTGSQSLQSGLARLQSGSQTLTTGATTLANNEQTFASKIATDAKLAKVPNPSAQSAMMADPVLPITHAINPVDRYGPGLAPYFIPLSLWVGALMLYFLMPLREGRWRITPVSGPTVVFAKFCVLWMIGVLQAVIASSVLLYGLGLTVGNTFEFYLFNVLCSIAYITVIGLLIAVLGSGPGRFIGVVLLLLQLTSSAGTFPLELVPGFFQHLHPFLPMTYAVTEIRNIIAIQDASTTWHNVLITASYWLVALCGLLLWGMKRLSPTELQKPDELVS